MPKTTRLRGIWDSHYPETINLKPFIEYCKADQPDIFVLGGDNISFDIISHWNDANFKNIGFDNVRKTLLEEAAGFRKQLVDLRAAMPKAKFVYILGNHEDWLRQFCIKYPQMRDLTIETLLRLKDLNITTVPFGKPYKLGKLYMVHGHQFGTENPAKQAVTRYHKSVAFGHHHGYIVWSDFSDIEAKEKHTATLIPCYCKVGPEYAKGRPNRWLNGFFYANFKADGSFYSGVQYVKMDGHFVTQDGSEF